MNIIGYIRVSTEQQDAEKQKHLLLEYAQQLQLIIGEFISVEMSSCKSPQDRKIDSLCKKLRPGDQLLVAELSRLGRHMLETLNLIEALSHHGVTIVFVRQPELSTTGQYTKLLLAIYSYFAGSEREFISTRTKQGLAAVKARGIQLERPKGSKNKNGNVLLLYRDSIRQYLQFQLSLSAIQKLINPLLEKSISYNSFKYFVEHDEELCSLKKTRLEAQM